MKQKEAKPKKKAAFGDLLRFHRLNGRFTTQDDLAQAAALSSFSTVSRAENGTVAEDTARDLVKALHTRRPLSWSELQDLATTFFYPDVIVRGDIRPNTIGLVITAIGLSPFWSRFIDAAERELGRNGYVLAIGQHFNEFSRQTETITLLKRDRTLAGMLVAPAYGVDQVRQAVERDFSAIYATLDKEGIPVVFIERTPTFPTRFPCVCADHEQMARAAVEALYRKGHRRIGAIFGPQHSPAQAAQYKGFVAALREFECFDDDASLTEWCRHWVTFGENPSREYYFIARSKRGHTAGRDAAVRLLSRPGERATALVCGTAALANETLVAVHELAEKGIHWSVPDDLSLIAAESAPNLDWAYPPIASIDYDIEKFARRAVQRLLSCIADPAAEGESDEPLREFEFLEGASIKDLRAAKAAHPDNGFPS